jgi:hypothetical protein
MNERRSIVPRRDDNPYSVVCTLVLIDLNKSFAERMYGDPNDGVCLRIEVSAAAEGLDGNGVLLDALSPAFETFAADEGQNVGEILGAAQQAGGEQPIELLPFQLHRR